MTNRELVYQALLEAGPAGVHSLDIRRHGLSGNPSERIRELRARGHAITATPEHRGKVNGTRYTLDAGADVATPQSESPSGPASGVSSAAESDTRLFDVTEPEPLSAVLHDWEAA